MSFLFAFIFRIKPSLHKMSSQKHNYVLVYGNSLKEAMVCIQTPFICMEYIEYISLEEGTIEDDFFPQFVEKNLDELTFDGYRVSLEGRLENFQMEVILHTLNINCAYAATNSVYYKQLQAIPIKIRKHPPDDDIPWYRRLFL